MPRRRLATIITFLGIGGICLASACVGDPENPPGKLPLGDGGSGGDALTTPVAPTDGGKPSAPDAAVLDAVAPGAEVVDARVDADAAPPLAPRDPYQAQWKAPPDEPGTSDYVVDSDAGVVMDKTTGLLWSRAALSAANLPPDGGDGSPTSQAEARAQCAAATIGGTKGWRLPTRIEFLSITSPDNAHVHASGAFDARSFDNLPLWVAADDASRNVYYDGHYPPYTFKGNLQSGFFAGQLHCVKAPYPVTDHAQPPDATRFTLNGSVLTDHVTHLEWFTQRDPQALMWSAADARCANLASSDAGAPAGPQPWRLPTLKEAASLWQESTKGFPAEFGITQDTVYFWTSSKYKPPPNIIGVSGYFRIYFDKVASHMDLWFEVNDFASTLCVRNSL